MIEWTPGTDAKGRVQMAGGKPAYLRSKCGRYQLARVCVKKDDGEGYCWRHEIWHINAGVATNLESRLLYADAEKLAEEHANGLVSETV